MVAVVAVGARRRAAVAVGSSAVSSAGAFDAVSVGMFLFAFCPLVETVWMDRDDALVRHATNAARACAAVADGDARRVSFRFSADPVVTAERARAFTPRDANARPCFTLKRALARGETRRLNLWEPRWLALLDALADANGGRLVGAELGCLLGHTRHYYGDDDDDPSRRVASVVVDNAFARARGVLRVVEASDRAPRLEKWRCGSNAWTKTTKSCATSRRTRPGTFSRASCPRTRKPSLRSASSSTTTSRRRVRRRRGIDARQWRRRGIGVRVACVDEYTLEDIRLHTLWH